MFPHSVQYILDLYFHFLVCSANDIFLSEQMVGEAMQSAEVYDFLVTGMGEGSWLDMQGMDRTDLCWIG